MSFTKFHYTKEKVQCQKNGSCIVNVEKDEVLMFSGYVEIQLKTGRIAINGYVIDANESKSYKLYSSPFWKHNCLSIECVENAQILFSPFDFKSKYRMKQSKTCDPIFKIIGCHFITNNDKLDNGYKPLLVPLSWKNASTHLMQSPLSPNVIMICGHTQSGKSTFSRYLVNCFLNKYPMIAFLDCDVGQSEFSAEGIVSITMIKQPLFGAAHTHLHHMKNSDNFQCFKSYYFGSNNAMDDPSFYLQCIHKLYSDFHSLNDTANIPLIVNTNGWTKGLGANMLSSLIIHLSPNHLIEIYLENQALFAGVEMDYLYQAKKIFIQQNKIHNWCLNKKNKKNKNKYNNKNNSVIGCWWKELTTDSKGVTVEQNETLQPGQEKWGKYLNNLLELKFDLNDNNTKWYENVNVSKSKKEKTSQEIQLFKAFLNANVHFVESVSILKLDEADFKSNEEKFKKRSELRRERQRSSAQKRLLAMISYFTQDLFMDNPAKYLRQMDCFKIGFNEISVMFLQHNMDINSVENKGLTLHALNGVIVGLCVMNKMVNYNNYSNQPPFKKQKYNKIDEWKLNVLDRKNLENDDEIECVGLGIIRSINVKKELFYLITPVPPIQLNKINLFIRGKTTIPSRLIYDTSILTPPLYINSTPTNTRMVRSTC